MNITIRERQKVELSRAEFEACKKADEFWELIGKGIVSLGYGVARQPTLLAGGFIGRARFGDVEIDITEKVAGSVEALLEDATEASFKHVRSKGVATESNSMIRLIIRVFLNELQMELARGMEKRYVARREESSLVAGRLDMTRTVVLRARGLRHKIAFYRQVLTADTPFNRVMLSAIGEVEKLRKLDLVTDVELVSARGLSLLFSEARSRELILQRSRLVEAAASLAEREGTPRRRQLLEMAGIILLHQSFEGAKLSGRNIPHTWFFSLERLFEKAVRRYVRRFAKGVATVADGNRHPHPIAPAQSRFEARPDLVLTFPNGSVAVGDMKFKEWYRHEVPSHEDLYQLLVHGSAFGASVAFFVYAGEEWDRIDLGVCTTGARILVFSVTIQALGRDVGRIVEEVTALCKTALASKLGS